METQDRTHKKFSFKLHSNVKFQEQIEKYIRDTIIQGDSIVSILLVPVHQPIYPIIWPPTTLSYTAYFMSMWTFMLWHNIVYSDLLCGMAMHAVTDALCDHEEIFCDQFLWFMQIQWHRHHLVSRHLHKMWSRVNLVKHYVIFICIFWYFIIFLWRQFMHLATRGWCIITYCIIRLKCFRITLCNVYVWRMTA